MPDPRTRNTDEANRLAKEAMDEAHTTCNNVYTQVDGTRDVLRSSWHGAAANKYSEALVGWLEELRLITNDMNRMIGTFGGTVNAMHATEDANLLEGSRWMADLNPNQTSAN
ncbi:WXG100 family type VII secretion target [Nocardiopsis sp. YSL2]|uniref:WXG100 family type VII secretion target n=1 Tax=Nocardiopsis sp. YSL2 TaxID=2939492 RepID=UPI0026F459B3|nr:WXG100 family type VII secretion target [Nocardiopsis sp. YSL2]